MAKLLDGFENSLLSAASLSKIVKLISLRPRGIKGRIRHAKAFRE